MKLSLKKLLATTFLATALTLPALAQEGDMQALVDRLERMDRDIKALNLKVYRGTDAISAVTPGAGEDVSGPLGARLSVRINELESQMRQMTGQIEETAYRVSQLNTRLDKLVADIDYRLTALEGGNPAARPDLGNLQELQGQQPQTGSFQTQQLAPPSGAKPSLAPPTTAPKPGILGTLTEAEANKALTPQPTQLPATPQGTTLETPAPTQAVLDTVNMSPEEIYQESRKMLMRSEFSQAEIAFKGFLVEHKDHKLTGNVRYWLGETYYVQGDYPQAAQTFLVGYQKTPRGAKAPDSLLKLGMSLTRMQKMPEACATFGKLRADFPKMPAHLSKTLERERTSAKCK